jgi:predicted NAD-dependent protein-ADP-ribosyltransferase YbiA (DUF1768 family)
MVVSELKNKINYSEVKKIDTNDVELNATQYLCKIHDTKCLVAIGNVNKKYENEDVFYVSLYLVNGKKVLSRIGVFEFEKDDESILYDTGGDIDINKLEDPLLFSFIDKQYISAKMKDVIIPSEDPTEDSKEEEEEEEEEEKEGQLKFPFKDDEQEVEEKQSKMEAEDERKVDKENLENWMQKFMTNNNYTIQDVESNGDCFFATLREGLKLKGLDTNVDELRTILANQVDDNILDTYRERYVMFKKNLDKENKLLVVKSGDYGSKRKKMKRKGKELMKESKATTSGDKKIKIVAEMKNIQVELEKDKTEWGKSKKKIEEDIKITEGHLTEVKFMEDIETIEQLQDFIKTSRYWADTWAMKTLEYLLNVKMIVLSSGIFEKTGKKPYHSGGDSVINCGDFVPKFVEEKGYFKPAYYIMTEHTGNHYKLILYKDNGIFEYHEIPYDIKKLILESCLVSDGKSEWTYIPKFNKMRKGIMKLKEGSKKSGEEGSKKSGEEGSKKSGEEVDTKCQDSRETHEDDKYKHLFANDVTFVFSARSADAKPGKGKSTCEKIADSRVLEFYDLEKIKHWRRVLSNFHNSPFTFDGREWYSVEHYFQGSKFKNDNPDFYHKFSLNDKTSTFNKDPVKAKSAGGKTGIANVKVETPEGKKKTKKIRLRPEKVKADPDYMQTRSKRMKESQMAKYKQNAHARKVLMLTKDAKLLHIVRALRELFVETMEIRKELRKEGIPEE